MSWKKSPRLKLKGRSRRTDDPDRPTGRILVNNDHVGITGDSLFAGSEVIPRLNPSLFHRAAGQMGQAGSLPSLPYRA
jgi:hypothetical protein